MDFYSYQHYLYQLIQQQQQTIHQLNTKVQSLTEQLSQLQRNPTITIEKLEYNFDQLKVETLEGTLNIGISPQDLANTEDLAIPTPNHVIELTKQLHQRVDQFLTTELDGVISEIEKQMNIQLNEQQRQLIFSDIQKQLPARMNQYVKFAQDNDRTDEKELFQTIRSDIIQAVQVYIHQTMSETRKGDPQ